MKRRGSVAGTIIIALVALVGITFLTVNYVLPFLNNLFGKRTYSQTNCLTDMITAEMDVYDIAKSYRDGQATVAVEVTAKNKVTGDYDGYIGSGVCVASNGYETSTLDNTYKASKGSYIATNYHVIDVFDSNDYSDCSVTILTEAEESYVCDLLWYNKDLDVALLYCDYVNMNYVKMKDRSVECSVNEKLDYEPLFTIGTPIETDFLNRLTVGNVASNNEMICYTAEVVYPTKSGGSITGYSNFTTSSLASGYTVLSNIYEDVVDITVGITGGNSGGGCFDENGYLVGLATLGTNVEQTDGNQMNGMVPIYPIMQVLDKLIENNEADGNNKIYTLESLNILGIDAYEADIASYCYNTSSLSYYFIDGKFFSSGYKSYFDFEDYGYQILTNSNSSLSSLTRGCVITAAQIGSGDKVNVLDRNDLLYLLLQIDSGDSVTFYYENTLGVSRSITVTL